MCPGLTRYLPELGTWPASLREMLQLWVCPHQCESQEDIYFFPIFFTNSCMVWQHDSGEKFSQGITCRMNVPLETETPSVPLFAFPEFPAYPSKSR